MVEGVRLDRTAIRMVEAVVAVLARMVTVQPLPVLLVELADRLWRVVLQVEMEEQPLVILRLLVVHLAVVVVGQMQQGIVPLLEVLEAMEE